MAYKRRDGVYDLVAPVDSGDDDGGEEDEDDAGGELGELHGSDSGPVAAEHGAAVLEEIKEEFALGEEYPCWFLPDNRVRLFC